MDENYYMDNELDDNGVVSTRNPSRVQNYSLVSHAQTPINVGQYFDSDSKYDRRTGNILDIAAGETTVNDERAGMQSGWDRTINSVANNLVTMGTTLFSDIAGLPFGILQAAIEGDISKVWDNPLNNAMIQAQKSMQKAMPIYKGRDYDNRSLLGKMTSGIFWAELVQNLGYAEAAALSGMATGGMSLTGKISKTALKAGRALLSATGEAAIEAVHSKNDEIENKTAIAKQEYLRMRAQTNNEYERRALEEEYNRTVADIQNDAVKAGNIVFGSNIALLSASNTLQFDNLWSRGFGTQRRLRGAIQRTSGNTQELGKYALNKGKTISGLVANKIKDATSEGGEEVAQDIIQNIPKNYSDTNTFNESIFNPEKRKLASDYWSAIGQSMAETLKDKNTAVDFMSGFLTGAIGVPMLRKSTIPIRFENNIIGDIRSGIRDLNRQQAAVDEANKRLQNSPAINAYYNGLVRHMAFQDDMNAAVDINDKATYKEAENAQFISDVMTFDEVGDVNRLQEFIDNAVDTSDEGIQALINETTKDGKGPFVENGSPMSIEEVRKIVEDKKRELSNKIQNYKRDKEAFTTNFPNLTNEALQDALYLKGQLRDITDRGKSLEEDINKAAAAYLDNTGQVITQQEASTEQMTAREGLALAKKAAVLGDIGTVNKTIDSVFKNMPVDEREELKRNIIDSGKLILSMTEYNSKLGEVLKNPRKSTEDRQRLEEKAVENDAKRTKDEFSKRLDGANTIAEINEIMNSEDAPEDKDKILADSQNPITQEYKRVNDFKNDVSRSIANTATDIGTMEDAYELLDNHIARATNYNDAKNIGSPTLSDPNFFLDNSKNAEQATKRYNEAMYLIEKGMREALNDEDFSNKFSKEEDSLIDEVESEYDNSLTNADGTETPDPNKKSKKKEKAKKDTENSKEKVTLDNTSVESEKESFYTFEKREREEQEKEGPVGDESKEDLVNTNENANPNRDRLPENPQGDRMYVISDTPEIGRNALRDKNYTDFGTLFPQYAAIFNYLKEKGAFRFVNEGKLKAGDVIKFMIDPKLGEGVILMVTADGQVVGNIDPAKSTLGRFLGLPQLVKKIQEEYANRENKDSMEPFIASMETHVSQILNGKIPVGKEEDSWTLADIPGVMVDKVDDSGNPILDDDGNPIKVLSPNVEFGIMKNGIIVANTEKPIKIIQPTERNKKEGRLYMLVKNSTGEYNALAVRVAHFNANEFNMSNPTVTNSPIGKAIRKALEGFNVDPKKTTQEDFKKIYKELKSVLYLGKTKFSLNFSNEDGIIYLHITDTSTNFQLEVSLTRSNEMLDKDTLVSYLIETLYRFNPPIQFKPTNVKVDKKSIERLILSGVLHSNIIQASPLSGWFTVNPIIDGKEIAAVPMEKPVIDKAPSDNPVDGKESAIEGTKVIRKSTKKVYYVDINKKEIKDENGKQIKVNKTNEILINLAWADSVFGNDTEGTNMAENKVLLPDGRVLDRTAQKYLTGEEAQKIIDKLNPKPPQPSNTKKAIDSNIEKVDDVEETINEDDLYRVQDEEEYKVWNKEKELSWLDKVLPNLSAEDRVRVVKGLVRVANSGAGAWGRVSNGIITLSDIAAEGTTYHEAFHVVFNYLLSEKEQEALYNEAREKWGDITTRELQEEMAESFREYIMTQENPRVGRRILNYFKDLLAKVLNWAGIRPSMHAYFRMINNGRYANNKLNVDNSQNFRLANPKDIAIEVARVEKKLDDYYDYVKRKVRELNRQRFSNEDLALRAYTNSGLDLNFYKGVTKWNAEYATYKIRNINKWEYERYKRDILDKEWVKAGSRLSKELTQREEDQFPNFGRLDADIQMELINRGYTSEYFDSLRGELRNRIVHCLGVE